MIKANDMLSIAVKQAPISEVIIANDSINIIKGLNDHKVVRSFKITNNELKTKYLSIPRFIKHILDKEKDTLSYILDGYHTEGNYTPNDDDYDDFEDEEYFERSKYEPDYMDVSVMMTEMINEEELLLLLSRTQNYHKVYLLQILKVIRQDEDDNIPDFIRISGAPCFLSLSFVRDDVKYINNDNKVTDYSISNIEKWHNKFKNGNNQIINTNKDIGFFITKEE